MKYRKIIRLPDYDYSQSGNYFITFCVNHRRCSLGQVSNQKIKLSEDGLIVEKWIKNVSSKFPEILIDSYVIMPNHIHIIIEINSSIENPIYATYDKKEEFEKWRLARKNMLIPKAINYLKSNSSREINLKNNEQGNRYWQLNYYEHIIRNEIEYQKIDQYIENNPILWKGDKFHVDATLGLP
ncbi:transposase [Pedobacter sp. SD-b]|uniref:Transposase n=1 Tax=Pedobacter segetis TaxID=2793069 RepID=A0ABS1BG90_9SPHI|nr:transposase [Pedobacter segetis]MBK0381892.1 transposase [Pedobacter segetis]